MVGTYLSFQTPDTSLDYTGIGDRYLQLLAETLEARGFATDRQGRIEADDWWFRASKGPWRFFIVLVLLGIEPTRWFLYVESEGERPLETADLREAVHPLLESVVGMIPGVSRIRWHPEWTTLREL